MVLVLVVINFFVFQLICLFVSVFAFVTVCLLIERCSCNVVYAILKYALVQSRCFYILVVVVVVVGLCPRYMIGSLLFVNLI